ISDLRLVTKKFPVREYMRSPDSRRNGQKTRQNKSTYRKIDSALPLGSVPSPVDCSRVRRLNGADR
ncbi:hypothetical protein ACCS66_39030, partial [Rhizobium ruizarguesonis]